MKRFVFIVVAVVIIGWGASQNLFLSRYISFFLKGGDPHTVGADWFYPTFTISETSPIEPPLPLSVAPLSEQDLAAFDTAAAYSEARGGQAFLIARGGRLVYEKYSLGTDRETLINPQSMSKSLLALAIGRAIKQNAINSVDDTIDNYIPELGGDARGRITIENLLHMSGGLEQIATGYAPYPWSRGVRQHFGTDFDFWVMSLQPADPPGTRFDYNNNETNLLGIVLERATGQSYQSYLGSEVWPALGLGHAKAYLDRPQGHVLKACCVLTRPIDWLRLGQLILDAGQIAEESFIDPSYLQALAAPSPLFAGYGYQVWRQPLVLRGGYIGPQAPEVPVLWWASEDYAAPTIAFAGFGFHMTWIIPSLDLVVVRINGPTWPGEAFDQSLIPNGIIRALGRN
jgi:CubicO group peptidase (beta-lactamase class C family)